MDMFRLIDGIAAAAARSNALVDGDYIKDGLWHCHSCNTPKQKRLSLLGNERIVFVMCKCELDKFRREEEAYKAQMALQEINRNRRDAFPKAEMENWTFEHDDMSDPRISNAMRAYVDNFDKLHKQGKGLILYGRCGSGKTFAAACVANALLDRGRSVMVTQFSRIANTLSCMRDGKQTYLDSFNKYSLLVLDDLGTQRDTEYMNEIVYTIIDARYRANLPMIITTNLSGEDLKNPKDIAEQRVYNRILERCFPIEVNGPDRRRRKIINEYDSMRELLGL